jgi:hypothetical protein
MNYFDNGSNAETAQFRPTEPHELFWQRLKCRNGSTGFLAQNLQKLSKVSPNIIIVRRRADLSCHEVFRLDWVYKATFYYGIMNMWQLPFDDTVRVEISAHARCVTLYPLVNTSNIKNLADDHESFRLGLPPGLTKYDHHQIHGTTSTGPQYEPFHSHKPGPCTDLPTAVEFKLYVCSLQPHNRLYWPCDCQQSQNTS